MKILKRFYKYIKPYWLIIIFTCICAILKTLINIPVPYIIKLVIDGALSNKNQIILGKVFTPESLLNFVFLTLFILAIFSATVNYLRSYLANFFGNRIILDWREDLYQHLQKLSLSFYENRPTGKIMSRILYDIQVAQSIVNDFFINLIMDFTTMFWVIGILIFMNYKLALLSFCIIPFYAIAFGKLRPQLKSLSKNVQKKMEVISGELSEKISGVKVVKAFTAEKLEEERFSEHLHELYENIMKRVATHSELVAVEQFLTMFGAALVLWYGGLEVLRGNFSKGDLIAFYSYLGYIYFPISRLTQINTVFQEAYSAMERVFDVFDIYPDVQEKPNASKLQIKKGDVEFSNVYFKYPAGNLVLKNINLKVEAGKVIAIVGRSGAGKTTLVNLIPRFYDVTSGRITIDGQDIRDVKLKSLRKQIGIVLQEPILFSGTVEENIRYGKVNATESEIIEVAKKANAHNFIMQLPKKYKTEIGERGIKLSGGERQRIAIARTLLKDPKILILDEATSSLDSESENLIQEALENLMKGRTSFVIAHRLSTVINADLIVVLEKGEIVEIGTHQELLEKGGIYSILYYEQFKKLEEVYV
jgi:subfamily B ATP-binding cassette protein MsbA